MTFATLLTLISSVALLILIAATALSKHKTSQSRYLLVLLVSILVWTDAIYISNIQISSVIDLFTNRLVFSLVPLYVLAFYRLVGTFRGENGRTKRNRTDNIITVLLVISIILSVATASIVSDVNYDKATSRYDIIPGPLYIPFLVSTVSFVIAAIVDLLRLQRVLVGVARSRVRILAFSTLLLTILVVISNAIIPRLTGSSEFASLAPLWIFVWLSLMSYSIFKHRLFDIYYVLGRIVYFTIAAFLLYLEFYAVFFVGKLFLGGSTSPTGYSFGLIFAVVASLLNYYFNQNISQKLSEFMSYFSFNPEDILRSYSKEVSTSLSIDQIATSTLSSLKHSSNPLSFGIYIVDPIQKKISHAVFFLEGTTSKIKDPSLLFDICSEWENDNNVAPLILEELTGTTLEPNSQLKTIADEMKKNNISASFALNSQQNTTGILVLGEKLNKLAYSTQDISFLENFSAILSVSLSRALLHQEVQEFNVTLQKKVDDATQKLQVRNTELRDLYNNLEEIYQKEKDLMDVAGHEFSTPASILKTTSTCSRSGYKNCILIALMKRSRNTSIVSLKELIGRLSL